MSPPRLPQLGSVVWAELEDAHGYRKVRPAVVVTPSAEITAGKPVRVVAITTRLPDPLPDDHVLLPWERRGTARSGLRRRCAAVASWQAEISVGDVQEVVGILPPMAIGELLGKVIAALPPPTAAPAPRPGDPKGRPSGDSLTTPPSNADDAQEHRSDETA